MVSNRVSYEIVINQKLIRLPLSYFLLKIIQKA
jgi:hypothetical protein